MAAQAKKYEKVNRDKREKIHLLSGILKCPVCGAGMYGNKSIKKRKDGSNYKDFYYYGCKHRNMTRGHKCDYKKQVHEEMLDASVAEMISKLVSNPKFSDLIRNKINMEVDTSALDQEIENYKIQLRKLYHNKDTILSDMNSLDYEDKHYQRRKTDLENHLYKTYDKIDDAEELLVSAKAKKRSLLADKITGDSLNKKRVQNNGIVPQYYVENSHPPIIPRDLYMQVQEEMVRRANLHSGKQRKKRVYSSKYALSSIVYCPKCGDIYRRTAWNNRGKHSIVWRCCTRVEHGPEKCDAPTIQESELQAAVIQDINQTLGDKDSVITAPQENVETVILQEDESSAENIEARLEALQKELLKLANSKKDYNGIADEIHRLLELKQNALAKSAEREGLKKRIAEMREFLDSQPTEVLEYDEQLVRRLIEKVTVYDERFEVEFKSGMAVDEER